MAEPLERLTNLLALLLETTAPVTLEQIAFEMSPQYPTNESARRGAFERDKGVLRDLGIPIEQTVLGGSEAGRTAYRIDRRRYELADLDLSDDERRALQLAVAAARSGDSLGQDGLWKLGVGSERPSLAVAATVPTFAVLPPLSAAIAVRSSVAFTYRGTPRNLDPYGLLLRDGYWYVVGRDHAHDELRTYRVDRIDNAQNPDASVIAGASAGFERPSGFDIRAVFPSDPKLLGEPASQITRAVVKVSGERAALVSAEVGDDAVLARFDDGSIHVQVPCVNRDAFRNWLLGLTHFAEVVSPPEVRDDVISWLTSFGPPVAAAN